jgi:periplasmic copper chaperone A
MWRIVAPMVASLGLVVAAAATDMTRLDDITIQEPWARASLGNAPNSAAYMTLQTTGAAPDRLISGSTPVAKEVELHTHVIEGGVAKMRPVAAIEVAPGQPTVLEPGGPHVMLRGLTQKLAAGATMPLTLVFEHAGAVTLKVPVEGVLAGTGPGHDGSTDHGEHNSSQ